MVFEIKINNVIRFLFFSFFPFFNIYSVEVGDRIEFRQRTLFENDNSIIFVKKYNLEIKGFDQAWNSFRFKSEEIIPTLPIYTIENWVSVTNFPTDQQINSLLENCELLGWRKSKLELIESATGQKFLKDVCITNKALFNLFPFDWTAEFYYYGHFPIFGLAKMESYHPNREVYYLKNVIFN